MTPSQRSPRSRAGTSSPRPPGWLAPTPPAVAIEIASRRITVAAIGAPGGQTAVSGYASETLPDDAVTPALTGANVAEPAAVAASLRRAFERAGLGEPRRAALLVPDAIARVSLMRFDHIPARAADLDQLVRWQLRKATPFPLDEATVAHVAANRVDDGATFAAVVARRDVIAQYEAVADAAGVHAGIVDLASFNVMNAVMGAGAAPDGDWLLVCLAHEGTTIAILRGADLLFYRHRASVDQEPLSALVHQTAMYHEDRLGGSTFTKIWVSGAALATENADRLRDELAGLVGVPADIVDVRLAISLRDRAAAAPAGDVLDALAAPVGMLIRERGTRAAGRQGPEQAA